MVDVTTNFILFSLKPEIEDWLSENCISSWKFDNYELNNNYYIIFINDDDYLSFILRWVS